MVGRYIDRDVLKSACPAHPITRFAPSPTGYLHMGHVLSMAYVFGVAEIIGAKVILRIEDHDRQRCRKEYEQAILDDMAWLGFVPHNWSDISRQSGRAERYQEIIANLWEQQLVYRCACSRKQILATSTAAQELFYPGLCRGKSLVEAKGCGIRLKTSDQSFQWNDLLLGAHRQIPAQQCGDFLLQDHLKNYTYNFAVVVDDIDQGVNVVVRGEDLLHCTARQMLLSELLGGVQPITFAHHPLLIDPDGNKLSKRFLSEGVIQRRLRGDSADVVLGEALWLAGLLSKKRPIKAQDVPDVLMGNR